MELKSIVPSPEDERLAIAAGFRWMSFIGIPIKGTPCYPKTTRVMQFMSPEQLADPHWVEFLEKNFGRPADGSEPLSYAYCSSYCDVAVYW